jgi:DNA helicase-2/ATP-dependent DNA helicase PcrA
MEYLGDFDEFGTGQAYRRIADYPGIVLTTAHSAKGLEWPVCIGMIGNFHDEVLDRLRNHAEAAEEKRRLLFVLATRARDELIITAPYVAYGKSGNYTYNRFLKESFEANGQEFSIEDIEKEKKMRALDRANARKKKEIEEYKNTTASQKVS